MKNGSRQKPREEKEPKTSSCEGHKIAAASVDLAQLAAARWEVALGFEHMRKVDDASLCSCISRQEFGGVSYRSAHTFI
jgi:hypothetical protein